MLGAYLVRHGLLPTSDGHASFNGIQGRHVGRPGRVSVELELDAGAGAGAVKSTRIIGQAVIVFQSALDF
jgi:predicted PhzF superfamily epimerase YddE/YHI9